MSDEVDSGSAKKSKVSEIQTLWVFALSSSDTPRCSCISNSSNWIFELSLSVLNLTVRESKKLLIALKITVYFERLHDAD